jgi:hypothetical protein
MNSVGGGRLSGSAPIGVGGVAAWSFVFSGMLLDVGRGSGRV